MIIYRLKLSSVSGTSRKYSQELRLLSLDYFSKAFVIHAII